MQNNLALLCFMVDKTGKPLEINDYPESSFAVRTPPTASVDEFINTLIVTWPSKFDNVYDKSEIILWKLDTPMRSVDVRISKFVFDLQSKVEFSGNAICIEKGAMVSDYFEKDLQQCRIHILVMLPYTSGWF